jgi:hypothetical protein
LLVEWGLGASRLGEVEKRTLELRPAVLLITADYDNRHTLRLKMARVFISVKEGP